MSNTVSISQAAEILQVTEKTIRNYIKRGFVVPEKWNGMWQISKKELREISEKKNIKTEKSTMETRMVEIGVDKDEYSDQMIALGKSQAYKALLADCKMELSKANERIIQLESSNAAGWTEARSAKALCENLAEEARGLREKASSSEKELVWVRREKDRLAELLLGEEAKNRSLLRRVKELEDRLHADSLYDD